MEQENMYENRTDETSETSESNESNQTKADNDELNGKGVFTENSYETDAAPANDKSADESGNLKPDESPGGDAAAENTYGNKNTEKNDSTENTDNIKEAQTPQKARTEETKAFSARLKARSKELEDKYLAEISQRDEQLETLKREYSEKSAAIERAREIISENTIKNDLEAVKKAYPEADTASLRESGEIYLKLMASGEVDAVTAYEAQMLYEKRKSGEPPASMGSVKADSQASDKDYYSPDEVDRLTEADFDRDPGLWGKVRRSMLRWYK